jgi:hypothetical protein
MLVSFILGGADCSTLFYYKPVFSFFSLVYPSHLMAYGHGVVIYILGGQKSSETNIWSELAMIQAGAFIGWCMAWRDVELTLFLTAFRFWPSLCVTACWIYGK